MADSEQEVVLLDAGNLDANGEIVTITQSGGVEGQPVCDDILQQALDEVSDSYDHAVVEYAHENIAVVADSTVLTDHNGEPTDNVGGGATYSLVHDALDHEAIHISADQEVVGGHFVVNQNELNADEVDHVVSQAGDGEYLMAVNDGMDEETMMEQVPQVVTTHVTATTQPSPLGSSGNPIRIIQQGNQYTSMQQLSPEQLAQIMQVVQEQQVAKSTSDSGGSTTLFNPQTQTRIVYRVIYPSELHAKGTHGDGQSLTIKVATDISNTGVQKRQYRKRVKDEELDKYEGPELTKEEKEQRKKAKQRTRAGRVSRPPKHMVQDYKHIHPVDWDEDHDDSDGGYSDFRMSDEGEEGEEQDSKDELFIHSGLPSTRPKNFKCGSCTRAYIGQAGLARHYSLNPSHGTIEGSQHTDKENGVEASTDESTQDSVLSLVNTNGTAIATSLADETVRSQSPVTSVSKPSVPAGRGQAPRGRGRPPLHDMTPMRRKNRLRDLARQCEDEELMEVILPRLAKVISLWEFLLMKVERGKPLRPHVGLVYREFEQLQKKVSRMCQSYLKHCPEPLPQENGTSEGHTQERIEVNDNSVATALGLSMGQHEVVEVPLDDSAVFSYKLLTTQQGMPVNTLTKTNKRTLELVTQEELADPESKRPRKRGPGRPPKYPRPENSKPNKPVTVVPQPVSQSPAVQPVVTYQNGQIISPASQPQLVLVQGTPGSGPLRLLMNNNTGTQSSHPVLRAVPQQDNTQRVVMVNPSAMPQPTTQTDATATSLATAYKHGVKDTPTVLRLDPVTGQLTGHTPLNTDEVLQGHQAVQVSHRSGASSSSAPRVLLQHGQPSMPQTLLLQHASPQHRDRKAKKTLLLSTNQHEANLQNQADVITMSLPQSELPDSTPIHEDTSQQDSMSSPHVITSNQVLQCEGEVLHTDTGQYILSEGQVLTEEGHVMEGVQVLSQGEQMIDDAGQLVVQPGHVPSEHGHVVTDVPQIKTENMHLDTQMKTDDTQAVDDNVQNGKENTTTGNEDTPVVSERETAVVSEDGEGSQIITSSASEGGQVLSEDGMVVSEGAQMVTSSVSEGGPIIREGGLVVSEGGPIIREGGLVVSEGGQNMPNPVSEEGLVVSEGSQVVTSSISEGSQLVHEGGQVVSEGGQVVSEGGQIVSDSGHIITSSVITEASPGMTESGHVINEGGHHILTPDGQLIAMATGDQVLSGDILSSAEGGEALTDGSHMLLDSVVSMEGEAMEEDGAHHIYLQQADDGQHAANIYQTEDGLVLIQNPDGTFQIHSNSDQPIPMETVQALLAMETEASTDIQQEESH